MKEEAGFYITTFEAALNYLTEMTSGELRTIGDSDDDDGG
jgi:hypothetical protein